MKANSAFEKRVYLLSAVLVACGLTSIFTYPIIYDYALSLKPYSILFGMWKVVPFDIPLDVHFFNWTNPEDIYNKSVKPKFKEVGPYRFWQTEEKFNITWNNNNGTVTFRQRKFWYYDETVRKNGLEDKITTVNTMTIAAAYLSRSWSYLFRRGAFFALSGFMGNIHNTYAARELLFDGYREPLVKLARGLPFFKHLNIPNWDNFGWFHQRNGSLDYDGVLNMGTGENSVFGNLYNWHHSNQTSYFNGECGRVTGSLGEFFPKNLGRETLAVFAVETRRLIILKYVGNATVNDILGYKYVAEESMLDNGTVYPENRCFCNGECVPSGVVNFTSTRHGVPFFGSLPHFYLADPYFLDQIEGLKPDPKKHEFFFVIEPKTGIPLEINIRVQVNVLVQPIPGISGFDEAPRKFLPVMWLQQHVLISGQEIFLLKLVLAVPAMCTTTGILLIVAGILLSSYIIYKKYFEKSKVRDPDLHAEQKVFLKTDDKCRQ